MPIEHVANDSSGTAKLLEQAVAGSPVAMEQLLSQHRSYLRRVVDVRMDPVLRSRVDPSDIVQETLLAATRKLASFAEKRLTNFRLWLRSQAMDRLLDERRRHVSLKRDVRREVSVTDASSLAIFGGLVGNRPSQLLARREVVAQVKTALLALNDSDRDILLMRHGEGLSSTEAAELLELSPGTASKRYGRAVIRLTAELRKLGVVEL